MMMHSVGGIPKRSPSIGSVPIPQGLSPMKSPSIGRIQVTKNGSSK